METKAATGQVVTAGAAGSRAAGRRGLRGLRGRPGLTLAGALIGLLIRPGTTPTEGAHAGI
jgi:hypothetical protein